MLLKDNFFTIESVEKTSDTQATYSIRLLPTCECYKGHFPGNPVSPGVCNMEMIRECAEELTAKRLFITTIKQCRLTEIASPQVCPEVKLSVNLIPSEDLQSYTIDASIADAERGYMTLKGTLTVC